LEQFGKYEDTQLNYLTSYITKNEETIKVTMRESFTVAN